LWYNPKIGYTDLGSSLTFSAHGWWGKEKKLVAAKNPVRPSKGMAEGGCGGNSAIPLQKMEASPAALLVKVRHHRKILFSLREEKIRRAQNEKSKEYFSVVVRVVASGGGLASLVPFKVGSRKVYNYSIINDKSPKYWRLISVARVISKILSV
jgi:hypothetical protein